MFPLAKSEAEVHANLLLLNITYFRRSVQL